MAKRLHNKFKIINDPVYGFITIPHPLIFDIIEHPYFQRLRRIKQLGLTHLVFPGALHTRFHHSLGAMHLTHQALNILDSKGNMISADEVLGTLIAILLHDLGHGPFSHALEHSLVNGINHEDISLSMMAAINENFNHDLDLAITIFNHNHPRTFLSQLISSQLDMDRLDYLSRDSYFTGVSEGIIGTERIISMLDVDDTDLVVEKKGIYSLEKFIIARRIMYWQVYMHKTVLAAEHMLINILKRAHFLAKQNIPLAASGPLMYFLKNTVDKTMFNKDENALNNFALLDDFDIVASLKEWTRHDDKVLSLLCTMMLNRKLFRCEIQTEQFEYFYLEEIREKTKKLFSLDDKDLDYFVIHSTTSNYAYHTGSQHILIKFKNGKVYRFNEIADNLDIPTLAKPVTKFFLCYPKQGI